MPTAPASLRSLTAAAFTGALAVAAHALAGGGFPSGGAAALLVLVAATTGVLAGTDRLARIPALVLLLAGGQLAGHATLTVVGHVHSTGVGGSWELMAATHAAAVVLGAVLMVAADRFAASLSRAIRCWVNPVPAQAWSAAPRRIDRNSVPAQHLRLLAASMSRRGPPGCVGC